MEGGGGAGHVREQGGVRVAALRPAGDQGARRVHLRPLQVPPGLTR